MRDRTEATQYIGPVSCKVVCFLDISHAILDFAVIVSSWTILIGVVMYPAMQLVGLLICAAILLRGANAREKLAE